ncbi:UDP-N-acetylglucosamine 2-epimerase [Helicobacter felis]|uniref:UDP-N-acetylglucosamine 2-epimerase n=1 Tax=Helicobacter felis TaxID=214 RepID=UPI000CF0DD62|nr:UDP-N-acetylglucosamine 2-epimerase [Helicobacter felis]
MKKHLVFVTNSRADYGKLKPLIQAIDALEKGKLDHPMAGKITYAIFVCGMHLLEKYGSTYIEIFKDGFEHVFLAKATPQEMDLALADTIKQFHHFVTLQRPDLIIFHGDRLETLACAIVGSFNSILSAHIEGGELSGTLDESIRHSVSKLAHLHFVCEERARQILLQMGERAENIFVIGSSDIDVMLGDLPSFPQVESRYSQIQAFKGEYAIFTYHSVISELIDLPHTIYEILEGCKLASQRGQNFVCIYPNNDLGSETILNALETLKNIPNFVCFPSMKFEYFLTLLKNAQFIIGNSSAGIREAGVYGVPCLNLGSRQYKRAQASHIMQVREDRHAILEAILEVKNKPRLEPAYHFGTGASVENFLNALTPALFDTPTQKYFAHD